MRSQMVRVDTNMPNAEIWQQNQDGIWLVGNAPTPVMLEYEVRVNGSSEEVAKQRHIIIAKKEGYSAKESIIVPTERTRLFLELLPDDEAPDAQGTGRGGTLAKTSVNTRAFFEETRVFAVGISRYSKEQLRFDNGAQDAEALHRIIGSFQAGKPTERDATLLKDEAATRAEIVKALSGFVRRANEKCLAIILLFTVALPDPRTGETYFLAYESDPENLVGTAIGTDQLKEILQRSRAGVTLVITDVLRSTQSISTGADFRNKDDRKTVNRAVARLSHASERTLVLSAAIDSEASFSDRVSGRSIFIRSLIAGLKGNADANRDKSITLWELKDFVRSRVIDATNSRQHPTLSGNSGRDFQLVAIDR
jgi:hypothetical protein